MSFNFEGQQWSYFDPPQRGSKRPQSMQELSESPGWLLVVSLVPGLVFVFFNIWLGVVACVATYSGIKLRYKRKSTTPASGTASASGSTATTQAQQTKSSSQWTGRSSDERNYRDLYYIILSALLGFNIFRSLFGREVGHIGECGSWIRPNIEYDETTAIGWFWDAGERYCPRAISGKLSEAVLSALALGVLSLVLKLRRR